MCPAIIYVRARTDTGFPLAVPISAESASLIFSNIMRFALRSRDSSSIRFAKVRSFAFDVAMYSSWSKLSIGVRSPREILKMR